MSDPRSGKLGMLNKDEDDDITQVAAKPKEKKQQLRNYFQLL